MIIIIFNGVSEIGDSLNVNQLKFNNSKCSYKNWCNCTSLTDIIISDNVAEICDYVHNLQILKYQIGEHGFGQCSLLTKCALKKFKTFFSSSSNIMHITILEGVEVIYFQNAYNPKILQFQKALKIMCFQDVYN